MSSGVGRCRRLPLDFAPEDIRTRRCGLPVIRSKGREAWFFGEPWMAEAAPNRGRKKSAPAGALSW